MKFFLQQALSKFQVSKHVIGMDCENHRSLQLQALEKGVLKLWEDLARAKVNATNSSRISNLLLKVDELAILVMEMSDAEQKNMSSCSSLVIIERQSPPVCQQPQVIEFPSLPSRTTSNMTDDYPDFAVIIAAFFVVFIAFEISWFILDFISEIFRSPC